MQEKAEKGAITAKKKEKSCMKHRQYRRRRCKGSAKTRRRRYCGATKPKNCKCQKAMMPKKCNDKKKMKKWKKKAGKKAGNKDWSGKEFVYTMPYKMAVNFTPTRHKRLEWLDRQNVACSVPSRPGAYVMKSFKMVMGQHGDAGYEASCRKAARVTEETKTNTRYTNCNTARHHTLEYLDRQTVKCHGKKALVGFNFGQHGCHGNGMKYKYTCMDIGAKSRKVLQTGCSSLAHKGNEYLDRQNLDCGKDKNGDEMAMNGFRLAKKDCHGDQMKYVMYCVGK